MESKFVTSGGSDKCVTCQMWGGPREIREYSGYVLYDNHDKGYCSIMRREMGVYDRCSHYVSMSHLRDSKEKTRGSRPPVSGGAVVESVFAGYPEEVSSVSDDLDDSQIAAIDKKIAPYFNALVRVYIIGAYVKDLGDSPGSTDDLISWLGSKLHQKSEGKLFNSDVNVAIVTTYLKDRGCLPETSDDIISWLESKLSK